MTPPGTRNETFEAGVADLRANRLDEAGAQFTAVIATEPNHAEALHLLGMVRLQQGQASAAVELIRRAVQHNPERAAAWANLGDALQTLTDTAGAIIAYERAESLAPIPELAFNLGNVFAAADRWAEACAAYRRAVNRKPDYIAAWNNLGLAAQRAGAIDEAIMALERGVAMAPNDVTARLNLGNLLQVHGRPHDAVGHYSHAATLSPNRREIYVSLGMAFQAGGQAAEAIMAYRQAILLGAPDGDLLINLGHVLRTARRWNEALTAYSAALTILPIHDEALSQYVHLARQICRWDGLAPFEARLMIRAKAADFRGQPFPLLAVTDDPALHLTAARRYARNMLPSTTPVPARPHAPDSRLRIAYLSADFSQHATAQLAAGLFENHDKTKFDLTAISFGPDDKTGMRGRLAAAFDRFIDVSGSSDAEIAEIVRTHNIQIAIDLKGYTTGHRAGILSHRPAPLQVSYLGYPATMGTDFIDYMIVDDFIVPSGEQQFYDEKLVYLPGCYQVNDDRRAMADAPTRAACGLPETGFVFCSFNNTYKISPPIFDAWMRLLRAIPNSVLWLLADNIWTPENLRREAAKRDIDPARLIFADRVGIAAHLARHACADLFLDTSPCTAHTTASEALWTGLPLVTLAGRSFAGRVAGSLLRSLGVPELIADDLASYERIAQTLAETPGKLRALRQKLIDARTTSSVFKTPVFTRYLETAYEQMWTRHQQGQPPQAFAVAE